jgi:RNA polymerase sigma factor (sigma-70 family)
MDITELNDISENFCITNGAYSNCPTNQRYDKQELNNSIMSAIGKLKGNYKTIAELFFLEEKSYEEISTVLDISMSNVKVTILRTREKLQELLSNVREMAY